MTGRVNTELEAILNLELRGPAAKVTLEAVVDTGFSDFLLLPRATLGALGLSSNEDTRAVLGDGSTVVFDVYPVDVFWDGEWRTVRAFAGEGDPLIGVSLLASYDLHIRFRPDGPVRVEPA